MLVLSQNKNSTIFTLLFSININFQCCIIEIILRFIKLIQNITTKCQILLPFPFLHTLNEHLLNIKKRKHEYIYKQLFIRY